MMEKHTYVALLSLLISENGTMYTGGKTYEMKFECTEFFICPCWGNM